MRLNGFIVHNNIIDREQEGFHKFHSTTSAMPRLIEDIYNGFNNKENRPAAFIDLETAFDSVWRDSLLAKLHIFGLKGRLLKWIEGFPSNRKARYHLKDQYGPIFFTTVGLHKVH